MKTNYIAALEAASTIPHNSVAELLLDADKVLRWLDELEPSAVQRKEVERKDLFKKLVVFDEPKTNRQRGDANQSQAIGLAGYSKTEPNGLSGFGMTDATL